MDFQIARRQPQRRLRFAQRLFELGPCGQRPRDTVMAARAAPARAHRASWHPDSASWNNPDDHSASRIQRGRVRVPSDRL